MADQTILLTGSLTDCSYPLSRLVMWDEKNQKQVVLLTNHHKLAASIVADIYKDRWKTELFFKVLKQNLKVKTFVGTSSNALAIQGWTALIALLLLKRLHHLFLAAWLLSNLAAMLRLNFFTYRELRVWL
ncbi:transposase [Desulfarculales bacterium]